ncbi:MAG: POTRA 1 protein [Candidatus Magasanikbacteria bacterium]|nr:POTRA 1 protein [Candidatus Magasanikbacteria bacterium]
MSRIPRDFHHGKYTNPFQKIRTHVSKPPSKIRRTLGIILLPIILMAWGVMLLRHPYFDLRLVTINGLERIEESAVRRIVEEYLNGKTWWLLRHRNYFVATRRGISTAVQKKFKFDNVNVTFKFPHEINISFKETERAFLAATIQGDIYYASGTGELIEPVQIPGDLQNILSTASLMPAVVPTSTLVSAFKTLHAEHTDLPLIIFGKTTPASLGDNIITATMTDDILKLIQQLKTGGLEISFVIVPVETLPEADFYTNEGWGIYLNLANDPQSAVERLNTLLKTKIKIRKGLLYVDLRFGDRVYYQ